MRFSATVILALAMIGFISAAPLEVRSADAEAAADLIIFVRSAEANANADAKYFVRDAEAKPPTAMFVREVGMATVVERDVDACMFIRRDGEACPPKTSVASF